VPKNPGRLELEHLERTFAATRGVVGGIGPAQLTLPTPCSEWDVRAVLNHMIGGSYWYAATARDGVSPPMEDEDDDYAAGDLLAAFDEGARQAIAAFGADGVLDGEIVLIGNRLPARVPLALLCIDSFTHGWDLAIATGAGRDLDRDLAELLLELAPRVLPEGLRGTYEGSLYQPRAAAPGASPPADRLAAHLGRVVPPAATPTTG
jgi:uncharacterized protein (TIGR03086 family)